MPTRRIRSRWGVVEKDEATETTRTYSQSNRAGKWIANNLEILDGGYFQGRDANKQIIYRFDREGLSLRDLVQPNAIQWDNQAGDTIRRHLWVNLPNYPADSSVEAGDTAFAPASGTVSHEIAVWAGPDDDLWGAGVELYAEDNVTSTLSLSLCTTSSGTLQKLLRLSWDGADRKLGFYGAAGSAKPTITGSRGSNAALASLLTALAAMGLLTDSTS